MLLYVPMAKGIKAQKAYSSHIWPKYPKAAFLKAGILKRVMPALSCKTVLRFLKGPFGTNRYMDRPPQTAKIEVIAITIV